MGRDTHPLRSLKYELKTFAGMLLVGVKYRAVKNVYKNGVLTSTKRYTNSTCVERKCGF